MRTHLEFRSRGLMDGPSAEGRPRGSKVARLIARDLVNHGFEVEDVFPEDWGWRIAVAYPDFPIWVGCGHYEEFPDGHLCFIEPSTPFVRRWLKRIYTVEVVERVASSIEKAILASGQASDLRWWDHTDV